MKVGDIVKSNLPYPRNRHIGIIVELRRHFSNGTKDAAQVYWDDDVIRGTIAQYLEVICK